MYKPKDGEWVKIVRDTCQHALPIGKIVKIRLKRTPDSWWVHDCHCFIQAEDVARLNPGIRKVLKNLESSVKYSVETALHDHPELRTTIGTAVRGILSGADA